MFVSECFSTSQNRFDGFWIIIRDYLFGNRNEDSISVGESIACRDLKVWLGLLSRVVVEYLDSGLVGSVHLRIVTSTLAVELSLRVRHRIK
jgi:hypothetical protein